MKILILDPKKKNKPPSIKNLADLPTAEAITKSYSEILKTPAVMVNTLKGIGVKAAVRIARNEF